MENFLAQVPRLGWAAFHAALLLIVFCVLLNIILGGEADSFISSVARNATNFLQSLPPGVLLGVALIVMIYGFLKARLQR